MSRTFLILPGVAAFLAGIAAGALTAGRREQSGLDPAVTQDIKRALANLETQLAAQQTASTGRFAQVEVRLDEHAAKLADMPSTAQIVSAMEKLLAKTMSSLDERLTSQARSIDTLKTTVSQTDSLLERVLESLDSLQSFTDPAEFAEDSLLQQLPV
jgi:chromosome segregation ATPase